VAHPVILTAQEAEIRGIEVQSQPVQIVYETLSRKKHHKNRAGRVAQGEGPEFKPQYRKKKKEEERKKERKKKHLGNKNDGLLVKGDMK
jgi:hypothetical protein